MTRKQLVQQSKAEKKKYYEMLFESLPSIDTICSQADYLDDEDGLLGGFSDAESRIDIMKKRIESSECTEDLRNRYIYKIKKHEDYLEYWNNANEKIQKLRNDGIFNVIKNECDGNVIAAYYDFIVAFSNEHNYAGPVINTNLLRRLLITLATEIKCASI